MGWSPLGVIVTAIGCALLLAPVVIFVHAAMVGAFFSSLEKLLSKFLVVTVEEKEEDGGDD